MRLNDIYIILASASPRRHDLLQELGVHIQKTIPADIDETPKKNEKPDIFCARMACEKGAHIYESHGGEISRKNNFILSADTVVAKGRRILGKPKDEQDAHRMITLLSGGRHRVYTSFCIFDRGGFVTQKSTMSVVKFKHMAPFEIKEYLKSGQWQGCAGGYAIQGLAAAYISFISGSYSNIVGLPLHTVYQTLNGLYKG